MPNEPSQDDVVQGVHYLTRAELLEAMTLLNFSERQRGQSIGETAFESASKDHLMLGVEAAAHLVASVVAELGNRGSGIRDQLAVVELITIRAGHIFYERKAAEHGPVGHA
jgi:hypothetical protein